MTSTTVKPIAPVDLVAERAACGSALDEAVSRVLHSGQYILGPDVESFERAFASYQHAEHAFGVASGTDALVLALRAVGVEPGDKVLTSPFTFFASAGTIAWIGARPVFCDVDPNTALLDPVRAAEALTEDVKCILPVHLYGQLADLRAFRKLCDGRGVKLVEDGAQAHGAERDGLRCGEVGDAACFSFYPTKNLGAAGDAGLVTARDEETARALKLLRDHGSPTKYFHESIGTNSRMAALQAAVLSVKLAHLERWNARRREIAAHYDAAFASSGAVRPLAPAPDSVHVYHQYTVRVRGAEGLRERVQEELAAKQIFAAVHYPTPVHLQPALAHLGHREGDFPHAEALAREVLCLPVHPFLTDEDALRVSEAVLAVV